MNKKDFWMAIYISAIASGKSPSAAKCYADDALKHLNYKWEE